MHWQPQQSRQEHGARLDAPQPARHHCRVDPPVPMNSPSFTATGVQAAVGAVSAEARPFTGGVLSGASSYRWGGTSAFDVNVS